MADSSILLKQFNGSNYSQYFPQNLPLDIANQFVNSEGKNSNDIFNYLRKYCQYWWNKKQIKYTSIYEEVKSNFSELIIHYSQYDIPKNQVPSNFSFSYSSSLEINQSNGTFFLKNPQTFTVLITNQIRYETEIENEIVAQMQNVLNPIIPCYIQFNGPIYYLPEGSSISSGGDSHTINVSVDYFSEDEKRTLQIRTNGSESVTKLQKISTKLSTYSQTSNDYLYSTERDKYQDDGFDSDKSYYSFLRIPQENTYLPHLKFQQLMFFETDMTGYSQKTIYSPVIDITNGVVGLQFNFIFSDDIQTKTYSSGTGLQILLNSNQLLKRNVSSTIGQKVFKKGERINSLLFFTSFNGTNSTSEFLFTTLPDSSFNLNSNFQLERIPIAFYSGNTSIVFSSRKIITDIYTITVS